MRDGERAFRLMLLLTVGLSAFRMPAAQNYRFADKRDPFSIVNKLHEKQERAVSRPALPQRPPGLAGLRISDVTVLGMGEGAGAAVVILKGTDRYTYIVRPGSRLLDGFVDTADMDRVVFVQEWVDDSGAKAARRIVKSCGEEG